MRIPSGVTDQFIYFVAVDATDKTTRETGLSSFTVYRSRNGAAAAAMTTPTVNETDATNMPGVYELLLDEDMTITAGNDSEEMAFHITATGMEPVTRTIELYRPKVTAGETIAATSGAVDNVTLTATATNLTNLPSIPANWLTATGIAADAITAAKIANDALTSDQISSTFVTEVWNKVVEDQGSYTAQQVLSVALSILAGETNTNGSVFRTPNDLATRATMTYDGSDNRTGATLTPSAGA